MKTKYVRTIADDIEDIIDKHVSSENDEIIYGLDRAATAIMAYFEEKNAEKYAEIERLREENAYFKALIQKSQLEAINEAFSRAAVKGE